jgi:hypothetical protein
MEECRIRNLARNLTAGREAVEMLPRVIEERDEARLWAIRFRELLGYEPQEWHQEYERYKADYEEYMTYTDTNQWPDWLKHD